MAKVTDPVCGMTVDTEKAPAQGTFDGQQVYFCSVACRQKYATSHKS